MNPCNVETLKCAQCGALRGEANGWFIVIRHKDGVASIRHASINERHLDDLYDAVCGKECLMREISVIF